MEWWMNIIVNLLPAVVIIALFYFLYRRVSIRSKSGMTSLDFQQTYADEMKKQNMHLERIGASLDKIASILEKR